MNTIQPLNTYIDNTYGFLFFIHENESQFILSQWQIHTQMHEYWLSGESMHPNEKVVEVFFECNFNPNNQELTYTLPHRVVNTSNKMLTYATSDKILVLTQIDNFYYSLWLLNKLDSTKKERLAYFTAPENWHFDASYRQLRIFDTISTENKEELEKYPCTHNTAKFVLQLKW